LVELNRGRKVFSRHAAIQVGASTRDHVERIGTRRTFTAASFGHDELHVKGTSELQRNRVLQIEDVRDFSIEPISPKMCAGFGIDKLSADPHPLAGPSDVTFEHITYAEFAPNLLYVDEFTLERKCSAVRDHEGTGKSRQLGRNVLGQAIDEIVLLRITTDIRKRQYDNGERGALEGATKTLLWATGVSVASLIA
jgi:hypothetical protein